MKAVSRNDALVAGDGVEVRLHEIGGSRAVYQAPGCSLLAPGDCQSVGFSPAGQCNHVISHIQAQGG